MNIDNRVLILIGHYGTGKTTISLNLALDWAKDSKESIALADLDVNNPYFRSRDWKKKLEDNNIDLIIPDEEIAFAENPFLPRQIYSVIQNKDKRVIIDLGGHEIGTKVLGSISEQVNRVPYDMWMIVNTFRPDMETVNNVTDMFARLQELSKLKITGLVNNTNLANLTTIDDILHGEKVTSEAAKELNVPFIGSTIEQTLLEQASLYIYTPVIPIKRFDLLKW